MTDNDKPKRKVLSAAERIAKLEADLEAAKKRASEKGSKRVEKIDAKLKTLTERRDKLSVQITELETERSALGGEAAGEQAVVDVAEAQLTDTASGSASPTSPTRGKRGR